MHDGTMASFPTHVERVSFVVAVVSGIVGAVAGGSGWPITAVVAGCLAAAAPIAGRYASQRLARKAELEADAEIAVAYAKADAALAELQATRDKLRPRQISQDQAEAFIRVLAGAEPFELVVACNRHEAEPSALHHQVTALFQHCGHKVGYYGGMTNSTVGIEVNGDTSPQKTLVMAALTAAGLSFVEYPRYKDEGMFGGICVWIGVHPGLSM